MSNPNILFDNVILVIKTLYNKDYFKFNGKLTKKVRGGNGWFENNRGGHCNISMF